MLKGNKGEWSELYVIIKMLADGELLQANCDLSANAELKYSIIKVYKEEKDYMIEFERSSDSQITTSTSLDKTRLDNTVDEFKDLADKILYGIKNSSNTFEIKNVISELNRLNIFKLKADTRSKVDVRARIYDFRIAKETDLGFSIKSLLGAKSTLFNTGAGNNFRYRIDNFEEKDIIQFNSETLLNTSKANIIGRRIALIENRGGKMVFQNIKSPQLYMNLKMIDGDLPAILEKALYYRFKLGKTRVDAISEILEREDPLNYYRELPNTQKLYVYKMKRFLMEAAMGMTSETMWMGEYDAFGGVIFAKKDGEIVCFHIYDINVLRDYLFNNTFFEQPSTGEDDENPGFPKPRKTNKRKENSQDFSQSKTNNYGWLLEIDGKNYIDINLQIRFTN